MLSFMTNVLVYAFLFLKSIIWNLEELLVADLRISGSIAILSYTILNFKISP